MVFNIRRKIALCAHCALVQAALANRDQRSVPELFASQKPSQKRKASDALPPSSEVPLPKRVSRVTKLGKAQEAVGADQRLLSHLIRTRKDLSSEETSNSEASSPSLGDLASSSKASSASEMPETTILRRSGRISKPPQRSGVVVQLQSSSDEEMSVDDVGSQLTSDAATSRLGDEEPDLAGTQDGPSSGSQPDADDPQPEYLFSKGFKTT